MIEKHEMTWRVQRFSEEKNSRINSAVIFVKSLDCGGFGGFFFICKNGRHFRSHSLERCRTFSVQCLALSVSLINRNPAITVLLESPPGTLPREADVEKFAVARSSSRIRTIVEGYRTTLDCLLHSRHPRGRSLGSAPRLVKVMYTRAVPTPVRPRMESEEQCCKASALKLD